MIYIYMMISLILLAPNFENMCKVVIMCCILYSISLWYRHSLIIVSKPMVRLRSLLTRAWDQVVDVASQIWCMVKITYLVIHPIRNHVNSKAKYLIARFIPWLDKRVKCTRSSVNLIHVSFHLSFVLVTFCTTKVIF